MKLHLQIKTKYTETYLYREPDRYPIENIVESITRHGTHIELELLKFNDDSIWIHKHKIFGYILAFQKQYRTERFI